MRTLYTRAPPRWWLASPVRFPLVKELVLYARIYTSVLRVWYVAPGYTVYTRLQMLHCLATNLVTNAAGVLLFLGSDQCTKEQTLLAGFASAIASSILTLASRLTFKWAYQRGELAAAPRAQDRALPPPDVPLRRGGDQRRRERVVRRCELVERIGG